MNDKVIEFEKNIKTYGVLRAKAQTAFESIGLYKIENHVLKLSEIIGRATSGLASRIMSQGLHNLTVNIPCGIIDTGISPAILAEKTFKTALSGFCGEAVKWDINEALTLCADILDDVNAHTEAQELREKIQL